MLSFKNYLIKLGLLSLMIISGFNAYSQKRSGGITDLQANGITSGVLSVEEISSNKFGVQTGRVAYIYNYMGNLREESYFNGKDELINKYIHRYNDKDFKIRRNRYNQLDTLLSKSVYVYNSDGSKSEEKIFRGEDTLLKTIAYKYDDNGRLLIQRVWANGAVLSKQTFRYNKQGKKIEQSEYKDDGRLVYITIFKYDSHGNPSEITKYKSNGSLFSKFYYKYTYDSKGNWTSQTVFDDLNRENNTLSPSTTIKRSITYY